MDSGFKRPDDGFILMVTFQYYRDLPTAMAFYEEVLGFELAIDQGWSKIYLIEGQSHIGLVDDSKGMQHWAEAKTCQICLRVPDVDTWYRWVRQEEVSGLTELRDNKELGIRAFAFLDPEAIRSKCKLRILDAERLMILKNYSWQLDPASCINLVRCSPFGFHKT